MKSLWVWDDPAARAFADDPLQLRVYTSRLLGQEPALVMHGGGNTSVKMRRDHFFGEPEEASATSKVEFCPEMHGGPGLNTSTGFNLISATSEPGRGSR